MNKQEKCKHKQTEDCFGRKKHCWLLLYMYIAAHTYED